MDNDNKNTSNTQGDKDLQSLISNAIENRKILDASNSNGPTGVIPIPSKEQQKADPIHESDPKQDKTPNKKKGWSKKKKTGIALGIIFVVFIIIIAIIVGLFFHYTGMLDRTKDTKINSGKAPINSSELTSEADTFDAKEKEDELKAQLQKQSSKISSDFRRR